MDKGNIIKVSHGPYTETAKADHVAYAKNINTNAAKKINENGNDGVKYDKAPQRQGTKVDGIDIIIGMFFDGTDNNQTNINSREADEQKPNPKSANSKHGGSGTSYANDHTNVDILSGLYPKEGYCFPIYIEGIGTTNSDSDSSLDQGLGDGPTGVLAKVLSGCKTAADKISALVSKDKVINSITFDVSGFSRGAAAARNFIYEVTKPAHKSHLTSMPSGGFAPAQTYKVDMDGRSTDYDDVPAHGALGTYLDKAKVKYKTIQIRFAGLFDTVASYGLKHSNDVAQLHLDAVNNALHVAHLTAGDETRENFPLVSVHKGVQFSLPGVHSDVGGGYRDDMLEDVSLDEEMFSIFHRQEILNQNRNWFIEQGWYKASQMQINNGYKLYGSRTLKNQYHLIPLHLMSELALKMAALKFDFSKSGNLYDIPKSSPYVDLGAVYTRLQKYCIDQKAPAMVFFTNKQLESQRASVSQGRMTPEDFNLRANDHNMLLELRNHYLHMSSSYDGIGMEPNVDHGKRVREVY